MCQAFQATAARYPHELALRTVEGGGDGHVGDRRRVRCWLICGRSCSGAGGMSGSAAAGGGCWPAAAPLPPCRSEPGSDERGGAPFSRLAGQVLAAEPMPARTGCCRPPATGPPTAAPTRSHSWHGRGRTGTQSACPRTPPGWPGRSLLFRRPAQRPPPQRPHRPGLDPRPGSPRSRPATTKSPGVDLDVVHPHRPQRPAKPDRRP